MNRFPESFVWGAASSAYQTEGSPLADGGGESVWSRFCAEPGHIADDDTGNVACDGYHRYAEDIAILAELGLSAYRFSTGWARVDPTGTGQWNQSGLAYYDRLVDCCLDHGITPWLTLYHWETPQAVEDRGGWLNPDTVEAFTRYAAMMAEHFKGRVKNYFTMNEPEIVLSLGYGSGIHAPGKHYDMPQLFTCLKHMLLANGRAMAAMRNLDPDTQIGIVTTGRLCYPEAPADSEAARKETFAIRDDDWLFSHSLILDPVCLGRFELAEDTKLHTLARQITPEQWRMIRSSPDMIGLNVYNGSAVRAIDRGVEYVKRAPGYPRTALKWPITPEIMNTSLAYIRQRYNKPLYITECGLSCNDKIYLDDGVHDPDRIDFLHRYLLALRAGLESSDVRGFFHWSLTDNFEWHSGYGERFGLVYVDYPTQRRILKDSAHWYSVTAQTRGANL